ncbi:MAG: NADH-quinone oxidoreductase subunit L, partial [Actinobacteria bacterium]|nr:NADH-quinone oxidoreductase subunit L [Actinomycetota bacterium]
MLLVLVWLPVLAGGGLWASRARTRASLGGAAGAAVTLDLAVAVWAAVTQPSLVWRWGGGLDLVLEVSAVARLPVVLVPLVALPIVAYAAAHEEDRG